MNTFLTQDIYKDRLADFGLYSLETGRLRSQLIKVKI